VRLSLIIEALLDNEHIKTARLVGLDILTSHMCVCFSHPDLALTSFLCAVSFAKRLAQEFPMWQVITIFEFPFMALK
jgi:hypothetical protein